MIRLFALPLCLFAIASFAGAEEPKKPDAKLPAFAVEVAKIQKDVEAKLEPIYAAVEKDYEAAKTESEREAIVAKSHAESSKIYKPAYEAAMKLLRPNAADPAAVAGLVWVCPTCDTALQAEIVALLRKHHLVHPETIAFAKSNMQSVDDWVEGLLRAQFTSPDLPKDQAWRVHMSLAVCLQTLAGLPALIEDNLELMEARYGKQRIAERRKADVSKVAAEARKLFTEAAEKYPKQEIIPGLTVGQYAKSSIFEMDNLSVGKVAPDIEGEDLDGVKFKLSDYRGKTVMLSFWASWCGPCMGMIPHERELVEKYKDRPFALIGVNGDPDKKDLKKVLEKITWRSFWCGSKGPEGPIPMTWNVNGWPTIYVIDEKGVIRAKNAHGTSLDARIEEWVKKAEANGKK